MHNGKGNRTMKTKLVALLLSASLVAMPAAALTGCAGSESAVSAKVVKLDPANPTTITVWHYYNGAQQAAFDALVDEFNNTVGAEQGIYVTGYSQGSVADLEDAVIQSAEGAVGADKLPDMFSTYNDTAASVMEKAELINIADYFSGDELSEYVDAYIQDGYINGDENLYVFPVAKSSEALMISKQDWEKFSKATGASLDDLTTTEGVTKVAEKYYEWTDAKTPKVKDDGQAFYGRDSMSNYFLLSMHQMGRDLVTVENGTGVLNTNKEDYRKLWDNYYVPMIKGYFASLGRFRSDDMKTGDLIAYTGSTSSAAYFPKKVEKDSGKTEDIEAVVESAPTMANGNGAQVQQGAGMSITKSDEEHQYAASVFLKWFTEPENNLRFVCESSYLPVCKQANTVEALDGVISKYGLKVDDATYATLKKAIESSATAQLYSYPVFKNAVEFRKVLDYELSDKAKADRKAVEKRLAKGESLEKATASYLSEESFERWYDSITAQLQETLDK